MHRALFWIPDVFDEPFPGLSTGEMWAVAERIAATWRDGNPAGTAVYDAERDAWVFSDPDDGEDGPEVYAGVDTEHGRLYPIGAWAWTWERED